MTNAAAFTKAMDDLEHRATGKEKFELMHSKGSAKAKLLQRLFNQYAVPWNSDWFSNPRPRPLKNGAAR